MTLYYEEWKEKQYACEECDWKGTGADCKYGLFHRKTFLEVYCPSCQGFLDLIVFPYKESCHKDLGKLTEEQRKVLLEQDEQMKLYLAKCLQSADQLPDLKDDDFILAWDQVEGETRITKGDMVIWSEPLAYEGFDRFEKIALLLKEKYAARIKDLAPADRSLLFLYGDFASSIDYVKKVRKELFGVM